MSRGRPNWQRISARRLWDEPSGEAGFRVNGGKALSRYRECPSTPNSKYRKQWLQQLVSSVGDDVLRFLRSRLRHGDLAQDLAQEVYLRLLRMDDVSLIRNPRAFVIHLAAHAAHEWRELARNRLVHSEDGLEELVAEYSDPARCWSVTIVPINCSRSWAR